jgi:NADH-quinone oxidoreductase subunit M
MIFVIGLFPSIFLDRMKDSVQLSYNQFKTISGQAVLFSHEHDADLGPGGRLLPRVPQGRADDGEGQEREGRGRAQPTAANGGAQ